MNSYFKKCYKGVKIAHPKDNLTNVNEEVKRYLIAYPITDYTFPTKAHIDQVSLDDQYLHLTLTDERRLSIPLWWILPGQC